MIFHESCLALYFFTIIITIELLFQVCSAKQHLSPGCYSCCSRHCVSHIVIYLPRAAHVGSGWLCVTGYQCHLLSGGLCVVLRSRSCCLQVPQARCGDQGCEQCTDCQGYQWCCAWTTDHWSVMDKWNNMAADGIIISTWSI